MQELQLIREASETIAAFVTYFEGIFVYTAPLSFLGFSGKFGASVVSRISSPQSLRLFICSSCHLPYSDIFPCSHHYLRICL